jgi:hypothetical protein
MDSLGAVEAAMAFEKAFGVELPGRESGDFGSPREMVDWLELHLSNEAQINEPPLCSEASNDQNSPELAEGLGRDMAEQIAAIVCEIVRP